jgi:formamidopyrimidine-DNA glycosylase
MPELPEVETVRLGLEPRLLGKKIVSIALGDFPGVIGELSVDHFNAVLVGRSFQSISRRGKYLIVGLDDEVSLIVHLRMTGVLTLASIDETPGRFQHLAFVLDNGQELRFADQRKFGRVLLADADQIALLNKKLGPEPLEPEFTAAVLGARLKGRKAPVKNAIMNQELIAGLGNIYVDEALFAAGIHPLKPADELNDDEIQRLRQAIRTVLSDGLTNRGTSFSHFKDSYGESGSNQHHLSIYGKGNTNQPCPRCGGPITKITVGGRGTHFCPYCQR